MTDHPAQTSNPAQTSSPAQPSSTGKTDSAASGKTQARSAGKSLNVTVRELLRECPSRQSVYATLMKVCEERLGATVVRADYRVGAIMLSDMRHSDRLDEALAQKFSDEYLSRFSAELRKRTDPEPQLKQLRRGDQQITLLCGAVMDLSSENIDGVLTLMLTGADHRPDFVLPMMDGICSTASAALMTRNVAAGKSRFQTQTAEVVSGNLQSGSDSATAAGQASGPVAMTMAGGTASAAGLASAIGQGPSQAAPDAEATAVSKAARFSNITEFGLHLVSAVSNQFGCEQVALGVEQRQRVRIVAVSGMPDFKHSSPGIVSIRQAMEECLDEQELIVIPSPEGAEAIVDVDPVNGPPRPIHRQWSVETNSSAVCSVPLQDAEETVAIVSLRRSEGRPFTSVELAQLQSMLKPYGAAIRLVEKAGQPVSSRMKTAVRTSAANTIKRGSWSRRLLLLGLLAAVGWFFLGSMTYEPLCRSTVTAANLRHFSAPFDGQLKSVVVQPGQRVEAGQPLVQFDTQDLELERSGLRKQISATRVEMQQAISERDLATASLAKAQLSVLQTQLESVNKRINDALIVAPANGVVVLADLEQRVGQAFPQGEEILQFVIDGDWLLELEVPDNLVDLVAAEQTGTFAPASDPTQKLRFKIRHVDGAAQMIDDRNVFVARAAFEQQPENMITGMEGTAKLTTVRKPVWWVACHSVIDWARMNFWI